MLEPLLLIVGGESDPNTQRVVDQAHLRGIGYRFWDTDNETARQIAWDFDSPQIDLGGVTLQPTAVFARYNVFGGDAERNLAAFETIQSYMLAWPQPRVLNRAVMTDANNKARNLCWAREAGFAIPQTLVMADLTPLATMPDPDGYIIKPLGGGAHTRSVSEVKGDVRMLAALEPQFVQHRLRGENLRLFWIGGAPYCFRLQSGALDYRQDESVSVQFIEPPPKLLAPAKRLLQRIGFDFCALDFRYESALAQPVFLEINSFPMFVRFDDAAGNRLVDAILDFLVPGKTQSAKSR